MYWPIVQIQCCSILLALVPCTVVHLTNIIGSRSAIWVKLYVLGEADSVTYTPPMVTVEQTFSGKLLAGGCTQSTVTLTFLPISFFRRNSRASNMQGTSYSGRGLYKIKKDNGSGNFVNFNDSFQDCNVHLSISRSSFAVMDGYLLYFYWDGPAQRFPVPLLNFIEVTYQSLKFGI